MKKFTSFVALSAVVLMSACQSRIPKEAMEEMGNYAKAVCACAEKSSEEAKPCIEALKAPAFNSGAQGSFGPKYKLESQHAYIEIWGIGNNCATKAGVVISMP